MDRFFFNASPLDVCLGDYVNGAEVLDIRLRPNKISMRLRGFRCWKHFQPSARIWFVRPAS